MIMSVRINALCPGGTGVVNGSDECDDGSDNSDEAPDACRADCTNARCGDGVIDRDNEACDDNLAEVTVHQRVFTSCGNGILEDGEDCDNADSNSDTEPNACRSNCTNARCGDGVIDSGNRENCDDGRDNTEDCTYGEMGCSVCSTMCMRVQGNTSFCGDGDTDLDNGEQCDDGNTITEVCAYSEMSCTVCSATCQRVSGAATYCGDGNIQETENEECDERRE